MPTAGGCAARRCSDRGDSKGARGGSIWAWATLTRHGPTLPSAATRRRRSGWRETNTAWRRGGPRWRRSG